MPTEPPTWRRIGPGVRKIPEPMTEPINKRKRSRRRSVRTSSIIFNHQKGACAQFAFANFRRNLPRGQAERIITGDLTASRRSWWDEDDWRRHKAKHENNQS